MSPEMFWAADMEIEIGLPDGFYVAPGNTMYSVLSADLGNYAVGVVDDRCRSSGPTSRKDFDLRRTYWDGTWSFYVGERLVQHQWRWTMSVTLTLKDQSDDAAVPGCTDDMACNFNLQVTEDDGSCDLVTCTGCTVTLTA